MSDDLNPQDADLQEADRYQIARKEIEERGLQEFLDWLCKPHKIGDRVVQICMGFEGDTYDDDWSPLDSIEGAGSVGEQIFAAYFDVDLDLVERYRHRLLDGLSLAPADDGYPSDWPRCPGCGAPALDGHITCGDARCNEGSRRP